MDIDLIKEKLEKYQQDMKRDLKELIEINSERDLSTKSFKAPFGIGIRKAFDKMIDFAHREGFKVEDFNGYALHIEYGEGKDIIGILGHLDIVGIYEEDKWKSNPFELMEDNRKWYGRGVNDNKGPMIGCFYLLKILKEIGYKPNKRIRLIIGGAEETTWECMDYYFKYNEMPDWGFSPDGDFPIVNCEKGISYFKYSYDKKNILDGKFNIVKIEGNDNENRVPDSFTVHISTEYMEELKPHILRGENIEISGNHIIIHYKGKGVVGRNPHRGENAIFKFVNDFKDIKGLNSTGKDVVGFLEEYFNGSIYGEKLGIFHKEEETGNTTSNLSNLSLEENKYEIFFDYRYPNGVDLEQIKKRLKNLGEKNNFKLLSVKDRPLLYVPAKGSLINALKEAYYQVTGEEAETLTKGGASYARVLKHGVAFGPTFPGEIVNSHRPNECVDIDNLLKALIIYGKSIELIDKI